MRILRLHFQTALSLRILLRGFQTIISGGCLLLLVLVYFYMWFPWLPITVSYLAVLVGGTNLVGPMEILAYNSRQIRQLLMASSCICIGIDAKVIYEFRKIRAYVYAASDLEAAPLWSRRSVLAVKDMLFVYLGIEILLLILHLTEFPSFLKSKLNVRDNRLFDKSQTKPK